MTSAILSFSSLGSAPNGKMLKIAESLRIGAGVPEHPLDLYDRD